MAGVKRVAEQKKGPRWLSWREMSALAAAVQKYGNKRDLALVVLLLHIWLRVAAAYSLAVDNVVGPEWPGVVRVRDGKGGTYREIP